MKSDPICHAVMVYNQPYIIKVLIDKKYILKDNKYIRSISINFIWFKMISDQMKVTYPMNIKLN